MFKQCNVPQMLKGFTRKNLSTKNLHLSFWRRSNFEADLLWPFLLKEPKTSTKPSWSWKCSWMFSRCHKSLRWKTFSQRWRSARQSRVSVFRRAVSEQRICYMTQKVWFPKQNVEYHWFYIQGQKLRLLESLVPPKVISSSLLQFQ